ncbi:hypothetical protein V494_07282 [Pseudogymnoascus sp. VKM F-4513 (FW-928)]|nr:hypothetical protein V494_07282 [Pseudogymnoascus sp. VKM F-4513 (FW-928)]
MADFPWEAQVVHQVADVVDMGIPFVPIAFTNDNPCHIKIVGPCLAIPVVVVLAVVCWPASLFCGCCTTERGTRTAMLPNKTYGDIVNAIPI